MQNQKLLSLGEIQYQAFTDRVHGYTKDWLCNYRKLTADSIAYNIHHTIPSGVTDILRVVSEFVGLYTRLNTIFYPLPIELGNEAGEGGKGSEYSDVYRSESYDADQYAHQVPITSNSAKSYRVNTSGIHRHSNILQSDPGASNDTNSPGIYALGAALQETLSLKYGSYEQYKASTSFESTEPQNPSTLSEIHASKLSGSPGTHQSDTIHENLKYQSYEPSEEVDGKNDSITKSLEENLASTATDTRRHVEEPLEWNSAINEITGEQCDRFADVDQPFDATANLPVSRRLSQRLLGDMQRIETTGNDLLRRVQQLSGSMSTQPQVYDSEAGNIRQRQRPPIPEADDALISTRNWLPKQTVDTALKGLGEFADALNSNLSVLVTELAQAGERDLSSFNPQSISSHTGEPGSANVNSLSAKEITDYNFAAPHSVSTRSSQSGVYHQWETALANYSKLATEQAQTEELGLNSLNPQSISNHTGEPSTPNGDPTVADEKPP
jgi:hypothetical protein